MSSIWVGILHEQAWLSGIDHNEDDARALRIVFVKAARAKGWMGDIVLDLHGPFASAEGDGAEEALAAGEKAVAEWVAESQGCE